MKVFDFDPTEYADEYRSQGWVHISEGVSVEFHEFLQEYARQELAPHTLDQHAVRGRKEQSLFEFRADNDYLHHLFDAWPPSPDSSARA